MRILVTGGRGMVGDAIVKVFKDAEILLPKKHELNVANRNQVMKWKKAKFDWIIHLAAETDHEYCDENPSQCYLVNTIGTANIVDLARAKGVPVIYQSAGSIFDGKKERPYVPADTPNPINHYNLSKYHAETIVRSYNKHFIIRSGWMFGGGRDIDKKFVNKIIKKIDCGHKQIEVCDDCIGSPTYTLDLAETMAYLMDREYNWGTYHCVNNGGEKGVSRYEFAREVVKSYGTSTKIVKCSIDDLKDEFPCKRTNYEVLENNFSFVMNNWKGALKGYIYANYRN